MDEWLSVDGEEGAIRNVSGFLSGNVLELEGKERFTAEDSKKH